MPAGILLGADLWIPITKLTAHEKITVVWLIGDHKQLFPLVTSKAAGINPFAFQINFSTLVRLILAGHAHFEMCTQGRMHREVLRFPNRRSYGGKLEGTKAANQRELRKLYGTWYKNYFNEKSDDGYRLFPILVDGQCEAGSPIPHG